MFMEDGDRMAEYAGERVRRAAKPLEVGALARDFEMSAAHEIAFDRFLAHDALDARDGGDRRIEQLSRPCCVEFGEQCFDGLLETRERHAAVARTRAPADRVPLEDDDARAALC
jgi:hypothetical protein